MNDKIKARVAELGINVTRKPKRSKNWKPISERTDVLALRGLLLNEGKDGNMDAVHAAATDRLEALAEEQGVTVKELVDKALAGRKTRKSAF